MFFHAVEYEREKAYSVADQNTCPVPRISPDWRAGSWVDSKWRPWVAIEGVDSVLNRIGVTVAKVWGTFYPSQSTSCGLEVGRGQGCREDSSSVEDSCDEYCGSEHCNWERDRLWERYNW